jgi:hypothetical protein
MDIREIWENETKVSILIFCAVVIFCCTALTVRQSFAGGQLISSDAVGWFSFLVTLVNDQTLNYEDTLAIFGRRETHAPIGTALAWLPFYLFGRLVSLTTVGVFGLPVVNDGTGFPEQLACCVGGIVYGAAGVALLYRLACRWFAPRWALPGAVLLFSTSNFPNYVLAEPYMTHSVSVFLTTLLLWIGMREEPLGLKSGVLIGLVAGVAALTRPTDGLFVVLPFLWHLLRGQSPKSMILPLFVAASISMIIFSFQLLVWDSNSSYTADRVVPKGFRGEMDWQEPNWYRHLFGSRYGLFRFHPIYLLALGGLPMLFRRQKNLAVVTAVGLAIQFYVICSWSGQGQSFGARMFLGSFPLFLFGTVSLLQYSRSMRYLLGGLAIPLVVMNFALFLNYRGLVQLF